MVIIIKATTEESFPREVISITFNKLQVYTQKKIDNLNLGSSVNMFVVHVGIFSDTFVNIHTGVSKDSIRYTKKSKTVFYELFTKDYDSLMAMNDGRKSEILFKHIVNSCDAVKKYKFDFDSEKLKNIFLRYYNEELLPKYPTL